MINSVSTSTFNLLLLYLAFNLRSLYDMYLSTGTTNSNSASNNSNSASTINLRSPSSPDFDGMFPLYIHEQSDYPHE